jgi:hypothetical protein
MALLNAVIKRNRKRDNLLLLSCPPMEVVPPPALDVGKMALLLHVTSTVAVGDIVSVIVVVIVTVVVIITSPSSVVSNVVGTEGSRSTRCEVLHVVLDTEVTLPKSGGVEPPFSTVVLVRASCETRLKPPSFTLLPSLLLASGADDTISKPLE